MIERVQNFVAGKWCKSEVVFNTARLYPYKPYNKEKTKCTSIMPVTKEQEKTGEFFVLD